MTGEEIGIRAEDFSVADEYAALCARAPDCGACVVFTGRVRGEGAIGALEALELEHYPGMTERSIAAVLEEARARWPVAALRVVHRIGRLAVGEQIVFVGAAAAHRGAAFAAAEFVMDYLKTRAPIWKKELGARAAHWVESRATDTAAAARWDTGNNDRETA
jgi:molybdopterin synthase catalytic subunit